MAHPQYSTNTKQMQSLILWEHKMHLLSSCTGIAAQLAFIMHSPISRTAFQWFNCRQIGDKFYIMADYSTECTGAEYAAMSALAGLIIIGFSAGLPIVITVYLFLERGKLRTPRVVARIGKCSEVGTCCNHTYVARKP